MTRNAFWGLCIGICMASTQSVAQKIENTNIQTDNQKNYTPSHINEITNGESLYTVRSDTSLHNIRTIQANSNPEVLDKLTAELKPAIPYLNEVGAQAMPRNIVPIKNPYFNMPQLKRPVFPDFIVNMKDKGMTEDAPITDLVNRTIAEVSKQGGGTVVIPEGKWKSARIVLKSNVNLHLAKGAEIEFAGRAEDYLPAVFTRHEGVEIMGPAPLFTPMGKTTSPLREKEPFTDHLWMLKSENVLTVLQW